LERIFMRPFRYGPDRNREISYSPPNHDCANLQNLSDLAGFCHKTRWEHDPKTG
jgi:hypothetical protein